MSNTKYIKVSVSERMPDKEGNYFIYSSSRSYEDERKSFFDGTKFIDKYGSNMSVDYWLQEVPDYEDEILAMLEIVCTELYKTDNSLATEVKSLLTKIKQ